MININFFKNRVEFKSLSYATLSNVFQTIWGQLFISLVYYKLFN